MGIGVRCFNGAGPDVTAELYQTFHEISIRTEQGTDKTKVLPNVSD
jgi:hypothetical protein